MTRRKILFGSVVACALTGTSQAGLMATPDPGGYATIESMLGTDETSATASWFFDEVEGIAMTVTRNAAITYSAFLPDKPPSAGGGSDDWRVGVTAIDTSGTVIPASYTHFLLDVAVDGDSIGVLSIPASQTAEQTAFIDIGLRSGATDVTFTWLNPSDAFSFYHPRIGIGVVQFSAAEVPTPGSLALAGLGALAFARRRRG